MRLGKDTSEPCALCGKRVWISEVVRYREAQRMYWFVTGICDGCQ